MKFAVMNKALASSHELMVAVHAASLVPSMTCTLTTDTTDQDEVSPGTSLFTAKQLASDALDSALFQCNKNA